MIYEFLRKKIPRNIALKMRHNGDMLVVNSDELEIFYLNNTGASFFEKCDAKRTIEEIEKLMLEEFDVDRSILRKDLLSLVRDLQWRKLIVLEGE